MEKEEKCSSCLPFAPRLKKKVLFVLVLLVIVLWFIYYDSCYLSRLNTSSKLNRVKPFYAPIYNIPLFHIPLLSDKDMTIFYLEISSNVWCLKQGTDLTKSKIEGKCVCICNWFGLDCGIPAAVWKSSFLLEGKNTGVEIRRRKKPRRVIVFFAVDDHYDLLNINIQSAFFCVDLFLTIEEKNHNPSVLNLVKEGYLAEYQSKIMPIQLNKSFVVEKEDKWSVFMLSELWKIGWKRLADFRPDDIFLFSHVSSIISKDILLFLKLYDGFPEPFMFELRPLLFKFWRQMKSNSTNSNLVPFKPVGCTFQYMASMCDYEITNFLSNSCLNDLQHKSFFEKNFWSLKNWTIGNMYIPSGWQCNLCCKSECIKNKIDKYRKNGSTSLPLWYILGNTSVIEHFEKSRFFNKDLSLEIIPHSDLFFAPEIVLNDKQYLHLIN
ncbi:beta-1,4-mannosyl-glycoprotein 4-beta-N-acetylglucosaminyltransferase [Trichonephila clavata]|uniref:Beta-1,4-mannosyl-glycoprotein 4-beta-N-acetylglucosaminyltransferase n=1 Tax=Trichonephila clavata TaxID=2740835 RepID=A0A8X6LJT9_TRICU|nr:beta-1,4-mannosyl-glycoprotein 4-beta-N-acetylglucosaminyltransferase [Trichonephila clavata]